MVNSHARNTSHSEANPQQAHNGKQQQAMNAHQDSYQQVHYTHGYVAPQPVAYDAQGRPLYAHPPITPNPQAQGGQYHQVSQQQPHHYGHSPTPDPGQDAYQHSEANQAQTRLGYRASSLVTRAPEAIEGHNYDPRMRAQYANEPNIVHHSRQHEPQVPEMSDKLRRAHEESKKKYPFLNLSPGEFVVLQFTRHPIGLAAPIALTGGGAVLALGFAIAYMINYSGGGVEPGAILGLALLVMLILIGVGWLKTWVYLRNQFFLTNEAVIQEIQHGPFSRHEQTVSLGSIEDASFKQYGLIPTMFNYGTIRLSTEGKDTVYRFDWVESPKEQVAVVTNAVDNFKNGRPVGLEALEQYEDDTQQNP